MAFLRKRAIIDMTNEKVIDLALTINKATISISKTVIILYKKGEKNE